MDGSVVRFLDEIMKNKVRVTYVMFAPLVVIGVLYAQGILDSFWEFVGTYLLGLLIFYLPDLLGEFIMVLLIRIN